MQNLKIYFFSIFLFASVSLYGQEVKLRKTRVKMIAQNDTILTDYIWQMYEIKTRDSIIVLIPKNGSPSDRLACKDMHLRKLNKVMNSGLTMRLYTNDLYIDDFFVFPKKLNVYECVNTQ